MMAWADLIDKCLAKDAKAEFEFYERIFPFLLSHCKKYRKGEYEIGESASNAFTHILLNLNKWDREIPFMNWANRVATNSFIDDLRAQNRYSNSVTTYQNNEIPEARSSVQNSLEHEDLRKLINELPGIQPIVFKLYVVDGFSHREIGQMLAMKENTSKWHLSEARKNLKSMVKIKT